MAGTDYKKLILLAGYRLVRVVALDTRERRRGRMPYVALHGAQAWGDTRPPTKTGRTYKELAMRLGLIGQQRLI